MTYRLSFEDAQLVMNRVRTPLTTAEFGKLTVAELLKRYQSEKLAWLLETHVLDEVA